MEWSYTINLTVYLKSPEQKEEKYHKKGLDDKNNQIQHWSQ